MPGLPVHSGRFAQLRLLRSSSRTLMLGLQPIACSILTGGLLATRTNFRASVWSTGLVDWRQLHVGAGSGKL